MARRFGCSFNVDQGTVRDQLLKPHKLRFHWTTVDGRRQQQDIDTCMSEAPALKLAA